MRPLQIPNIVDTEQLEAADSTFKAGVEDKIENLSHMEWQDVLRSLATDLMHIALKIAIAIAVFYVGRWLIRKLNHFLGRIFERRRIDQSLATFLLSLISITLTIFLIIVVVEVMGMNASTFLALFAAAGLAIGMALSGTMQNFAGGVMVLLLKPYRIGDYIEAQGQAGTVKSIQLFNTVITTPDNKTIIIPNGPISTGIVNNYSREPVRRVDWNFGIDYSQDFDTVQKIIRAILASDERVLKEREILVEVNSLGPISVNLLVSAWVKSTDNLVVFYAMNHRFLNELKAQGIEFPNVTDIKIDSDKL